MALNEFKIRIRTGEELVGAWSLVRQRLTLLGNSRQIRRGDTGSLKELVALRNSLIQKTDLPEMIDIPARPGMAIMKSEATVGLFKQVMGEHEITGKNIEKLRAILADPAKAEYSLNITSSEDARVFALRLGAKTGRHFCVPSENDWLAVRAQLLPQLSGDNRVWVERIIIENKVADSEEPKEHNVINYFGEDYRVPNLDYKEDLGEDVSIGENISGPIYISTPVLVSLKDDDIIPTEHYDPRQFGRAIRLIEKKM